MAMLHEKDPAQEILEKVGDLKGVEVFGADILIAIYKRPDKTRSGIHLADTTRDEDKYQGKVGLVLKLGPLAFKDDHTVQFHNRVEPGDWIAFRTSDSWPLALTEVNSIMKPVDCRILRDTAVKLKIDHPDAVY